MGNGMWMGLTSPSQSEVFALFHVVGLVPTLWLDIRIGLVMIRDEWICSEDFEWIVKTKLSRYRRVAMP